jgi:hypothetical protein
VEGWLKPSATRSDFTSTAKRSTASPPSYAHNSAKPALQVPSLSWKPATPSPLAASAGMPSNLVCLRSLAIQAHARSKEDGPCCCLSSSQKIWKTRFLRRGAPLSNDNRWFLRWTSSREPLGQIRQVKRRQESDQMA